MAKSCKEVAAGDRPPNPSELPETGCRKIGCMASVILRMWLHRTLDRAAVKWKVPARGGQPVLKTGGGHCVPGVRLLSFPRWKINRSGRPEPVASGVEPQGLGFEFSVFREIRQMADRWSGVAQLGSAVGS